jgi:hypothetical protein
MNISDLILILYILLKPATRLSDSKAKLYISIIISGSAYKNIKTNAISQLVIQALKDKIESLPLDN